MKKWEKPKLIVLVRSRPEESVLVGCKWDMDISPLGTDCMELLCHDEVLS